MEETLSYTDLETIVTNLNSIYLMAKTLHWEALGYADHLLYDRVADGIQDDIDAVMEAAFLPFYELKIGKNIIVNSVPASTDATSLLSYIEGTIDLVENSLKNNNVLEGVKNVLSNVSNNLLVKQMLLRKNLQKKL